MGAFRRLVYAALCAGLLSGIIAAGAHQLSTVPLILEAEIYEQAAQHSTAATHGAAVAHEPEWEPENGIERAAYTLVADLLTAIGFALLLAAGLALRGGAVTWRDGWPQRLLWSTATALLLIFTIMLHRAYARDAIVEVRNFYGTLRVKQTTTAQADPERMLLNGTIQHGTQIFAPNLSRLPTTYYATDSGIGYRVPD